MYETIRVKCGETLDIIGPFDALGKVYDVLLGPCRRKDDIICIVKVAGPSYL